MFVLSGPVQWTVGVNSEHSSELQCFRDNGLYGLIKHIKYEYAYEYEYESNKY